MTYDFIATIGGRGQRHPHGLVGKLFRINDPSSVRIGDCFLKGRLRKGDLFLCMRHSGDCFQNYMYVEENSNCLIGKPGTTFGSYGIGDAESINIGPVAAAQLKAGEWVHFEKKRSKEDTKVYIEDWRKS